ncbi:C1-like protein kinase, partial [Hamiltosporidium magnivora]
MNDFELIKTTGTGTFGRVYLARLKRIYTTSDKFFAIKMMRKSDIIRLRQVEHVYNEKILLSYMRTSPFIVKLYSTFHYNNMLCMVLEYVPGGELFYWLKKMGSFGLYATRFYTCEVLLALQDLHLRNIIYRDLKPENILLTASGHIKLTDFGFSKSIDTLTYTVCGTPEYMAPEKLLGEGHSKEVDYWSLGILIHEMLTGNPPFYNESHYIIYQRILNENINLSSCIDKLAGNLIERLVERNVSKRLGSCNGVSEIMEHPFFYGVDWYKYRMLQVKPPIVPFVRSAGDTSNFQVYEEEVEGVKDKEVEEVLYYRFINGKDRDIRVLYYRVEGVKDRDIRVLYYRFI